VYFFWDNIPTTVKLPLIATEEDTGPFTRALLEVAPGKNLIAYRAWMTMGEYLEIIGQVKGVKVISKQMPPDASWEALPEELVDEVTDNAKYIEEFGYEGRDDPTLVHPKDVSLEPVPIDCAETDADHVRR
jgi:hypothetical protein